LLERELGGEKIEAGEPGLADRVVDDDRAAAEPLRRYLRHVGAVGHETALV
jgi:hypothetical protein